MYPSIYFLLSVYYIRKLKETFLTAELVAVNEIHYFYGSYILVGEYIHKTHPCINSTILFAVK